MKTKDIRNMAKADLEKKVGEWEEELFNLRFQAKMGQLANALQLRHVRRDIAKAKTILNEMNRNSQS